MSQNEFRTYKRRETTRTSGFHTCDETTGGECIILHSQKIVQDKNIQQLTFTRKNIELIELFEQETSIIAFGGYIRSSKKNQVSYSLSFSINSQVYKYDKYSLSPINENQWHNIGFHKEISTDNCSVLDFATVNMTIEGQTGNILEFISFDFDIINKDSFLDNTLQKHFYQKTTMHIPYLYYLNSQLDISKYLTEKIKFILGRLVILKSCNRCGRFLPVNDEDEIKTLSFSLHCKKRAPCVHSSFRSYTIMNLDELTETELNSFDIENNDGKLKVKSYYGHQLECKACKKFFVNAPLNPQRNPQQFKEDGLRRRAIEILVNELLGRNLVHFEFEKQTKKQFSEHIWNKFGKRCFKCQKKIPLEEMHLDHTMPLAYLYRLDETATCLCSHHNSHKRDHFPVDFYTKPELLNLSKITGLTIEQLHYRGVNEQVLFLILKNLYWYFDDFLMRPDYQKHRDGILTADKINDSLKRVIDGEVDLAEEYKKMYGEYPRSITIG
jgi:hypothetical protein